MKPIHYFLAILLLAALLVGCNAVPWSLGAKTIKPSDNIITENRDVSGFTSVNMATIGQVTLMQGDSESLTIEGPDNIVPLVKTDVRNGVLVIEIPDKVNISVPKFENLLTFTIELTDLTDLVVSGAGTVEMSELNTDTLMLDMSGAGAISLNQLTAANLNVNVSGVGKVTLTGTATNINVDISGAGQVDAGDLQSQTASITISGLGSAILWVTDTLTGNITGGGSVQYYGNPKVDTQSSGLGKFESLGNK